MHADIAVVGGGIAGVSVAAELSRDPTLTVILLEQENQLAHHASGRSAAAFTESYGSPEIRAVTRASRPFLASPASITTGEPGLAPTDRTPEATESPLLHPRRVLWVGEAAQVSTVESLLAAEPLVRPITEAEARTYCPALRPGWVAAAAAEDGAQDLDVAALFDRYRKVALRNGVSIVTGAGVHAAEPAGDGWVLRLTGGQDSATQVRTVVNAAGAWADRVAQACGVAPIGLRPLRRTVAIVSAGVVDRGWPLVCEVAEAFYFRPEGDGLLISPADETPSQPCDARPAPEDVALALERANDATTLGLRHVRTSWAGLRTFAADRNPVVGFDPAYPGFFWLAGQGGYGMQTAPGLARLAAALVRGEPVPDDLVAEGLDMTRLWPQRFRAG